jgi:hypothetical protein
MADTRQHHAGPPPVEGDGISYSGIVWFVVVLTIVTVTCQLLMWILLRAMQHQPPSAASMASPLAPVVAERPAPEGRVYPDLVAVDTPGGVQPPLLVQEPANLEKFRHEEDEILSTYGWVDKNAGTVRIPIERAKALLLERGLPVRK